MSHTLAPPPPLPLRGFWARLWADPESRSTLIGLAGVLLIHLILWLLAPHLLSIEHIPSVTRPHASSRQFNIELAPETFAKPVPKPPLPNKFVETNPDAPENTPDKTQNFSDRNQQVAQEKPTPNGASDRPALEGKKDFESTQIVSGRLTKPIEHIEAVPPAPETTTTQPTAATPRAEQNPLPGFEKKQGEDQQAYGSNVTKIPENTRPIPERIEGAKNVPQIDGATAMEPAVDPKRPRPRPMVTQQQRTRPAIFAENQFGTKNIGPIAYDAKWSNYGAYLQRMIDTVQIQWERILTESKVYPPVGTTVSVRFILDSEGKIARIVDVDNHSTDQATHTCISAITDRAPYGAWTDDMKAVLGDQQEMTFTFYYQ